MSTQERRICSNCGATNLGQHNECLLCGRALTEQAPGTELPEVELPQSGGTGSQPPIEFESTVIGIPQPTPRPPLQRRQRASQLRFFLDGQGGEVRGKRYPLHQQALIGRDVKADINLYDGQVSRRHAMILVESEGIVIRDLGSANGTHVNGRRIAGPVVLKPDDLITIGASSWKLIIVRR